MRSFGQTATMGQRLLADYPQYTQLCRSIKFTLDLNDQNRQAFEMSMKNTEVISMDDHPSRLSFSWILECACDCSRNPTGTRSNT